MALPGHTGLSLMRNRVLQGTIWAPKNVISSSASEADIASWVSSSLFQPHVNLVDVAVFATSNYCESWARVDGNQISTPLLWDPAGLLQHFISILQKCQIWRIEVQNSYSLLVVWLDWTKTSPKTFLKYWIGLSLFLESLLKEEAVFVCCF